MAEKSHKSNSFSPQRVSIENQDKQLCQLLQEIGGYYIFILMLLTIVAFPEWPAPLRFLLIILLTVHVSIVMPLICPFWDPSMLKNLEKLNNSLRASLIKWLENKGEEHEAARKWKEEFEKWEEAFEKYENTQTWEDERSKLLAKLDKATASSQLYRELMHDLDS